MPIRDLEWQEARALRAGQACTPRPLGFPLRTLAAAQIGVEPRGAWPLLTAAAAQACASLGHAPGARLPAPRSKPS